MFRVLYLTYLCSEALLTPPPPIPGSGLGRSRGSFPQHKSYYHSTCSFFGSFSSFGPAGSLLPLTFLLDKIAIVLVTKLQFHVIKKTSDLDWLAACPAARNKVVACNNVVGSCCRKHSWWFAVQLCIIIVFPYLI